jgi:hypothetical protein
MSNEIKFDKVRAGIYVGGGYVISRNQHGCWVVKQGAERLTFTTTLKAAQKWAAAR